MTISRNDLEHKLRQVQDNVDDAADTAKPAGISIGLALVAGVVGASYVFGQRKAKKVSTVVEIRRV